MAVRKMELDYPYNVKVIGKAIENLKDLDHYESMAPSFIKQKTESAFDKWLQAQSLDGVVSYSASLTHRGEAYYDIKRKSQSLTLSYEQASNVLELFEGQTLEFVVGIQ